MSVRHAAEATGSAPRDIVHWGRLGLIEVRFEKKPFWVLMVDLVNLLAVKKSESGYDKATGGNDNDKTRRAAEWHGC